MVVLAIPVLYVLSLIDDEYGDWLSVAVAFECILAYVKVLTLQRPPDPYGCSLEVWYFFQPFRKTGSFVLLIANVLNDVVMFLVLAFIVMVGFALAFFVMYRMVDSEDAEDTTEYFQSLHYSILSLFVFLSGNFEIEVLSIRPRARRVFLSEIHRHWKALRVHDVHLRDLLRRRGHIALESPHRHHGRHIRPSKVHRRCSASHCSRNIHRRMRSRVAPE